MSHRDGCHGIPRLSLFTRRQAFRYLLTLRAAERQMLDDAFQFLADNPHLGGDYQERAEEGRSMEVLLRGRFLLTFWVDHAVKEVRVVRVEKV